MSDPVPLGLVSEAKTKDLPEGDAHLAWENLKAKFEPDTTAALVDIWQEFATCKMTSSEDPDAWISQLERLRQRLKELKGELSDLDLMIHVLNNLPSNYESTTELLLKRLKDMMNKLTVKEMRYVLCEKYK